MKYFIGIEGVGMANTVAVLSSPSGEILAVSRMRGKAISLHTTPRDILSHTIVRLLNSVLQRVGEDLDGISNCGLCIGLTGVTFDHDRSMDLPQELFSKKLWPGHLACTGDAEIVFASHTQSTCGSAVLCHCGSTAYVATPAGNVRFGGWGPAFGDEGSGYWLGCRALRAVGLTLDQGLTHSILWDEISRWLNHPDTAVPAWKKGSEIWKITLRQFQLASRDSRQAIFRFAHQLQQPGLLTPNKDGADLWRKIAAGITIPLFRAYRRDDPLAIRIINEAAVELESQHFGAIARATDLYSHANVEPLVLYGGVLTHNPELKDIL